jgi:hypothetical protein
LNSLRWWQILRGQHAHLRETIKAARTAARHVLATHGLVCQLQVAVIALETELLAHLADEERLLEPVLATLDEGGPVRAGLLRAEHAHQRAVLAVLTGPKVWPAATLVAGRTLSLCGRPMSPAKSERFSATGGFRGFRSILVHGARTVVGGIAVLQGWDSCR